MCIKILRCHCHGCYSEHADRTRVSLCAIYQKELTILGSFVNPDTHSRAAALIASGRLRLKELITHRFPVDRLREAIETQAGPESIKVLVVPEEE